MKQFLLDHNKFNLFTSLIDKNGYGEYASINKLNLTETQKEKAVKIIKDNNHHFWKTIDEIINSFQDKNPGYQIGFAGMNNQYFCLYKNPIGSVMPTEEHELDELKEHQLLSVFNIVSEFDMYYKIALKEFKQYLGE